jgi:integrase
VTIIERRGRYGVKAWDSTSKSYRWLGTTTTLEAAQALEREHKVRSGQATPSVREWAQIWLSDYARPAPATRMVYRQAAKRITSELGALKLGEVDRRKAREHALKWPRNVSAVARTMWNDALRDGVVSENPWTNMGLKQSRGRKDITALTEEQLLELAQTAQRVHKAYGLEAQAIILTLGYVGIRPGELCGLKHEDLDLPNAETWIKRSRDVTNKLKPPKNGKARRVVIFPGALSAMQAIPETTNDRFVFHSPRLHPLNKASLNYMWRPIQTAWTEQGNRSVDLYSLRHCAATMLKERGVSSADIAIQLGHTDGGRLVDLIYGHPSEDRARERLKQAYGERSEQLRRTG